MQKVIYFILQCIVNMIKLILNIILQPYRWIKRILYIPYARVYKKSNDLKDKFIKYTHIPKIIISQFDKYKRYLRKPDK